MPKISRAVTITPPRLSAREPKPFVAPEGGHKRPAGYPALKTPAYWKAKNVNPAESYAANAGTPRDVRPHDDGIPARATVESMPYRGVVRLPGVSWGEAKAGDPTCLPPDGKGYGVLRSRWRDLRTGLVYTELRLVPTSEATRDWSPEANLVFRDEFPRGLHKAQRKLWPDPKDNGE